MNFLDFVRQPWPWYVAGPRIGLTGPTLLLFGNKSFGISSSLQHIFAACLPANMSFFKYDWKKGSEEPVFCGWRAVRRFSGNLLPVEPQRLRDSPRHRNLAAGVRHSGLFWADARRPVCNG